MTLLSRQRLSPRRDSLFEHVVQRVIGLGLPLVQRPQRIGRGLLEAHFERRKSSSVILPTRWSKLSSRSA